MSKMCNEAREESERGREIGREGEEGGKGRKEADKQTGGRQRVFGPPFFAASSFASRQCNSKLRRVQ